jgi:hypothetical protein
MGIEAGPSEWFLPSIIRAGEPTTRRRMFRPVAHSGEKSPPIQGCSARHASSNRATGHRRTHPATRREGKVGGDRFHRRRGVLCAERGSEVVKDGVVDAEEVGRKEERGHGGLL